MNSRIYVMTHTAFDPPKDPLYQPLQVGAALHPSLGYPGDDTGDTISAKNPWYCELTGLYWVWKNVHDVDIVGLCHYRRYPVVRPASDKTAASGRERLLDAQTLQRILIDHDILTSQLLTLSSDYQDGFAVDHHSKDLETLRQVLWERCPADAAVFEELVQEDHTYFGNIFAARKPVADAYCEWLFSILSEVEKRTDMTGYDGYTQRLYGFLAEFLLLVYTRTRHLRVYESRIAIIGEKTETAQLREKLAACFLQRDEAGAKQAFLEAYHKKPDILMEASDINGKLRLCMEIISICEYERSQYGTTMLEQNNDCETLIGQVRRLNLAAEHFAAEHFAAEHFAAEQGTEGYTGRLTEADRQILSAATPQALHVALQVVCRPEDAGRMEKKLLAAIRHN